MNDVRSFPTSLIAGHFKLARATKVRDFPRKLGVVASPVDLFAIVNGRTIRSGSATIGVN